MKFINSVLVFYRIILCADLKVNMKMLAIYGTICLMHLMIELRRKQDVSENAILLSTKLSNRKQFASIGTRLSGFLSFTSSPILKMWKFEPNIIRTMSGTSLELLGDTLVSFQGIRPRITYITLRLVPWLVYSFNIRMVTRSLPQDKNKCHQMKKCILT